MTDHNREKHTVYCAHCALPVRSPVSLRETEGRHFFCCAGCRQIYVLLRELRPDRWTAAREQS